MLWLTNGATAKATPNLLQLIKVNAMTTPDYSVDETILERNGGIEFREF